MRASPESFRRASRVGHVGRCKFPKAFRPRAEKWADGASCPRCRVVAVRLHSVHRPIHLADSIVDGRQALEEAGNGHQGQMKVFLARCSMPSYYTHASNRAPRKSWPSVPPLRLFSPVSTEFFTTLLRPPPRCGPIAEELEATGAAPLASFLSACTLLLICVLLVFYVPARNVWGTSV